jgi:hypothetical protein
MDKIVPTREKFVVEVVDWVLTIGTMNTLINNTRAVFYSTSWRTKSNRHRSPSPEVIAA